MSWGSEHEAVEPMDEEKEVTQCRKAQSPLKFKALKS